jgi:ABC-type Mn2+/Zn2+ transport system permease subunit
MQRALLEGTLVSIACGVIGVLVVLRGLAFMGDALAHCVVPGVVVALIASASRELWGGLAAVLSAWAMAVLMRRQVLTSDAAIAIVFTGMFALGLAMISATRNYFDDLTEILFGAILAVGTTDLLVSGLATAIVVGVVAILYWPLLLVSFDPTAARSQGLPVERLDLAFFGLLSLTIVSAMVAVGTILVTGLLIIPAATARLIARRVSTQMILSALLGCIASWLGLYLSYYFRIAAGGAIILSAAGLFALALIVTSALRVSARALRRVPLTQSRATSA